MSTVEEIAAAIEKLPLAVQRRLVRQLREHLADAWDLQIEEDATSGRFDPLWEEAKREIAEHKTVPLNEVLDDPKLS